MKKLNIAAVAIALLIQALPCLAQTPQGTSIPKSAVLVNPPKGVDEWEVGDVQVKFVDGHTELFSKGEKCGRPEVSAKGDVGWSVWKDAAHSGETLRVRLLSGTIKNFKPNNLFIMSWGFVDKDSAVVIESMAHHGSSSYIKYDIATGKELGRVDDYVPYKDLPKWAQPFADKDS